MLTEAQYQALAADLINLLLETEVEPAPTREFRPSELAIPCHRHECVVGTGLHKHECPNCGTTWKHSNDLPGASSEQFWQAHSCPSCGTKQTLKFGEW